MRKTLFTAVSNGTSRGGPGLSLLALCAPLLIAATPIELRPAAKVAPAEPAIVTPVPNDDRSELACWLALCIGAGGIVFASRRRRRVATD
jgi:hypothetical protein